MLRPPQLCYHFPTRGVKLLYKRPIVYCLSPPPLRIQVRGTWDLCCGPYHILASRTYLARGGHQQILIDMNLDMNLVHKTWCIMVLLICARKLIVKSTTSEKINSEVEFYFI